MGSVAQLVIPYTKRWWIWFLVKTHTQLEFVSKAADGFFFSHNNVYLSILLPLSFKPKEHIFKKGLKKEKEKGKKEKEKKSPMCSGKEAG